MRVDEDAMRSVEKVLREPAAAEFSDQAWKVRTNLIIASTIGLVMALADLRIDADSSILGLRFVGMSDTVIRVTIAAIIAYLFFHFLWLALDAFLEWRLRVTGTRRAFVTGSLMESRHADIPVNSRQSTLYNWWWQQSRSIGELGNLASNLRAACDRWEADIRKLTDTQPSSPNMQNLNNVLQSLSECGTQAARLAHNVEANTKAITDERIPTSLKRFDAWFELFLRSQNLRWLVIELVAPIVLALFALYILF